jgi:hypothetical protein
MITRDNNRRLVLVCRVARGGSEGEASVKGKRFPLPETLSFSSKAVHLIFWADEGSDSISYYDCPRVQFVTIACNISQFTCHV